MTHRRCESKLTPCKYGILSRGVRSQFGQAAKLAGLKQVPTIQVEDLSPEKVQLLALAENKLSESGGWDESVLQLIFGNLAGLDLDLDLTLTAFDVGEIDLLLGADDDAVQEGPSLPPASLPLALGSVSAIRPTAAIARGAVTSRPTSWRSWGSASR